MAEAVAIGMGGDTLAAADVSGVMVMPGLLGQPVVQLSAPGYRTTALRLDTVGQVVLLEPFGFNLDQVVISAGRSEQRQREVAQRVLVLDRQSQEHINAPQTGEFLQNSGAVLVQKSQGGGGSPVIRGFEANKILLVVDGIRLNHAIFRGGHLQNVLSVDQQMVDRTELLMGPASVVYGSDALGGVIHFFTPRPALAPAGEGLQVSGNAFSRVSTAFREKTLHTSFQMGHRKWATLTSITASALGDLQQGGRRRSAYPEFGKCNFQVVRMEGRDSVLPNADVNRQLGSGYSQIDLMQKVFFQPSSRVSHTLNLQYSTTGNVNRYDRLSELRAGRPRFAEWYYGPQMRLLAAHTVESQVNKGWVDKLVITTSYQQFKESRHDRSLNSDWLNRRFETVQVIGWNAVFMKNTPWADMSYGAEVYHNQVDSKAHAFHIQTGDQKAIQTRYPVDGSAMSSAAVFAWAHRKLNHQWIVDAGVRMNYNALHARFTTKTFFDFPFDRVNQQHVAFSGNLGLTWLPNENWKLSGLLASGFRAPNIDDVSKVFDSVKSDRQGNATGVLILPNAALRPEYTYQAECTIEKSFGKRVHWNQTFFYTRLIGAIGVQNSTFNGTSRVFFGDTTVQVQQLVNLNQAQIIGYHAAIQILITERWKLESSFNTTQGVILGQQGRMPLDHIPPNFGQSSLWFVGNRIKAEFMVRYNGWKRLDRYQILGEDNLQYATSDGMPNWYTLNARLSKTWGIHWTGQLAVENILDRNYRVFASGISAAGRNVIGSVRYRF
ncbi:MAG TPA: TonB-dependent receptor [Luteibaculaceae bacterium]|nr:TonB-dependent receptor [Luteibaculaceae bacterium]